MDVVDFIAKWKRSKLSERAASQSHFNDLCSLLGHPTPADVDATGEQFTFEKGVTKEGGGEGRADVWKRKCFGWEYKGKHKDLEAAYSQLLRYRNELGSPPLLIVCDMEQIIIRTNFTGTISKTYVITLDDMADPQKLRILYNAFFNPNELRPDRTPEGVTKEAAQQIADLARELCARGLDPKAVAHFLDRVVFSFFAEDIGLLPERLFTNLLNRAAGNPALVSSFLRELFSKMVTGGNFGLDQIRCFNGNLFDDPAVLEMTRDEVNILAKVSELDWTAVDPTILGTLFERGLDPEKRKQIGAHFTGKDDILLIVNAVVMNPLRGEWAETRQIVENLFATGTKSGMDTKKQPVGGSTEVRLRKARGEAESILIRFHSRLQQVKVLDPACGSGNFLFVTLQEIKNLEKEVSLYATGKKFTGFLPMVGPWQLYGIESNQYAFDLAQMTVWLGWLQWLKQNGYGCPTGDPILRTLAGNVQCRDAILDLSDPANPKEPDWPTVDFIVGNPPFLGDKLMRHEQGDAYVDWLRALYADRIPGQSDLCCYWFEKARAHIAAGKCKRAGLLATQGIRGGANREVLKRIKEGGDIFWAESDRPWILNGANVHVSMVGFDDGRDKSRTLDGKAVTTINSNLTAFADLPSARVLDTNSMLSFIGTTKGGDFDISELEAKGFLTECPNAHGRPNSDVLRPILNGLDILRRGEQRWVIDNEERAHSEAAMYEAPHGLVIERVKPSRDTNRNKWLKENWWKLQRIRADMRTAIAALPRFLASPRVAKHRLFLWFSWPMVTDDQTVVFARSDDLFFGVLHSRFHEVWALKLGTRLETRPRYTPSTCFETFPFPYGIVDSGPATPVHADIEAVSKELNELRENWLNPPEWTRPEVMEFPGTVGGPWNRYIDPATVTDRGAFKVGTVRYPRLVARDAECAARLKERTLTKLYNERPAWLADCHAKLDAAVAIAYGWPADMPDEQILQGLLDLNHQSGAAQKGVPFIKKGNVLGSRGRTLEE